jgi:hypothetical protein
MTVYYTEYIAYQIYSQVSLCHNPAIPMALTLIPHTGFGISNIYRIPLSF